MTDAIQRLTDQADGELASETAALQALDLAEAASPIPEPDAVLARLPEKGTTVGLHHLLARALETAGNPDEADRILLAVAERLNQAGYWKALTRITGPLLDRLPREAGPLIARARNQGGSSAVEDSLLERAHRRLPGHGLLAWLTAEARLARGEDRSGRRAAAAALPELVEEKNVEAAELALLVLAEDREIETVLAFCRSLETLARQESWDLFETILDLGAGALASEPGAAQAWPRVRELWRKHSERESLRKVAAQVARGFLDVYPDPDALLRASEIERPSQPADVVLAKLETLVRFPPGFYARHSGWGIGEILENDTDWVVIDFPTKPSHRMTVATAGQALEVLKADDLRVLLAQRPEEVERLRTEEPETLVVLALRCLPDGRGTTDEIRKILVPDVLVTGAWAGWWKSARTQMVEDARIDTRLAYTKVYALAGARVGDVELPEWAQDLSTSKNLAVLDTFLDHYPDKHELILETHAERVEEIAGNPGLSPEVRVVAGLWLHRVGVETADSPEGLVGVGFDMNALSKAEQLQLLDRIHTPEGLAGAMNTRLTAVRRRAWTTLQEEGGATAAAEEALRGAVRRPEAALEVLETPPGEDSGGDPNGSALALEAVFDLLERPPRETHRKRAMALVAPDSPLGRLLAAQPVAPERRGGLITRLQQWQASDRYRFPVLDLLREIGLEDMAEEVEGHRARAVARLTERAAGEDEDPYAGTILITRATLDRLDGERRRIGMELKTIIPRAIQKAREMGDLRENAEYDAAKSKQANHAKRFEELDHLLNQARLIESVEREPEVALPGTEVVLKSSDPVADPQSLTFWLLGEGDQELGEGVVSYLAPVGKAILGRRLGEIVSLPGQDGTRDYRIVKVMEKLP